MLLENLASSKMISGPRIAFRVISTKDLTSYILQATSRCFTFAFGYYGTAPWFAALAIAPWTTNSTR